MPEHVGYMGGRGNPEFREKLNAYTQARRASENDPRRKAAERQRRQYEMISRILPLVGAAIGGVGGGVAGGVAGGMAGGPLGAVTGAMGGAGSGLTAGGSLGALGGQFAQGLGEDATRKYDEKDAEDHARMQSLMSIMAGLRR